jgi:hypothetical protein
MAKVFDHSRKKHVELLPEEKVRQGFVQFLINKGFPQELIRTEYPITLGQKQYRVDIVVFKNSKPLLLVECKAPRIKLDEQVWQQLWRYNYVLQAKYLAVTNGKQVQLCKLDGENCKFYSVFLTWKEFI